MKYFKQQVKVQMTSESLDDPNDRMYYAFHGDRLSMIQTGIIIVLNAALPKPVWDRIVPLVNKIMRRVQPHV